jgi:hypothetical protein
MKVAQQWAWKRSVEASLYLICFFFVVKFVGYSVIWKACLMALGS